MSEGVLVPEQTSMTRRVVLDARPISASIARDVVRDLLRSGGLTPLEDEATLLVSEVVTNALLHAGGQAGLTCEIRQNTLSVEVTDRSPVIPAVRHYDEESMTGRGLGLVELIAHAWGVEPTSTGKTVWFQLVSPDATDPAAPRASQEEAGQTVEQFTVRLRNAPVDLLTATVQYSETMLRELTLSAFADGDVVAPDAGGGFPLDLGVIVEAVRAAEQPHADVDVVLPVGAAAAAWAHLSALREAGRMARAGQLLTIVELPELAACREWLLGEIGSQADGGQPVAWQMPDPLTAAGPPVALSSADLAGLARLDTAALVADETNQVVYVNAEAEQLLGWPAEELIGRRLVTIVPHELRQAHLAGFGRFLLTREARLLGRRIVLPTLRADGSRIDITLRISLLDIDADATVFLAEMRADDGTDM